MADDDLFIDNDRIQKMIAAGIYDEDTASRLKTVKNKDLKSSDMIRPAPLPPPPTTQPFGRQPQHLQKERHTPFQSQGPRGRGMRGRGRGNQFMSHGRGDGRPPFNQRGRGGRIRDFDRLGFESSTAHKWQEVIPIDDEEEDFMFNKRRRSPSPQRGDGFRDSFRDGIRDGIQNKIQRNDFDRNAGNSDTDLRPKSDTDSRIRDTDLRPATNSLNTTRKRATNLSNITSAANDDDFRRGGGAAHSRGGASSSVDDINRKFFGSNSGQRSIPSTATKQDLMEDIDDFIEKASQKLNITPAERESFRPRGQTSQRHDNRGGGGQRLDRSRDPLGLTQPEETFKPIPEPLREDEFDSAPEVIEVPKETDENPIEILRETVEELAKSNLYCQYCDCYLSSLVEVNTHIGTPSHQQNMTKKTMEENNSSAASSHSSKEQPVSRPVSQTIVERVATGMAAVVQMIGEKKPITLKSLIEMDNYEITCESEAALAKELAKLLTNELLNYKMNLMPDTVKEALKHQGIGLLNSVVSN